MDSFANIGSSDSQSPPLQAYDMAGLHHHATMGYMPNMPLSFPDFSAPEQGDGLGIYPPSGTSDSMSNAVPTPLLTLASLLRPSRRNLPSPSTPPPRQLGRPDLPRPGALHSNRRRPRLPLPSLLDPPRHRHPQPNLLSSPLGTATAYTKLFPPPLSPYLELAWRAAPDHDNRPVRHTSARQHRRNGSRPDNTLARALRFLCRLSL